MFKWTTTFSLLGSVAFADTLKMPSQWPEIPSNIFAGCVPTVWWHVETPIFWNRYLIGWFACSVFVMDAWAEQHAVEQDGFMQDGYAAVLGLKSKMNLICFPPFFYCFWKYKSLFTLHTICISLTWESSSRHLAESKGWQWKPEQTGRSKGKGRAIPPSHHSTSPSRSQCSPTKVYVCV